MAATSTKNSTFIPDLDAVTERAHEANERLAEVSRKVTTAYLDGIEKYVADVAKFERKLGEQTKVDAVASLLRTHAQLTEDVAKASVSAARELITA
jgi:hypothetical protein